MPKKKKPEATTEELAPRPKRPPAGIVAALSSSYVNGTGENNRITFTNLQLFDLPKVDLRDPEAVRARLVEYFKVYGEADMKPTVAGMAMALGISRQMLWAIAYDQPVGGKGYKANIPEASADSVKKAYRMLEIFMENYANNGKINPVMAIFMLKNNFGYQDKTELVHSTNTDRTSEYDYEELRSRYIIDSGDFSDSD